MLDNIECWPELDFVHIFTPLAKFVPHSWLPPHSNQFLWRTFARSTLKCHRPSHLLHRSMRDFTFAAVPECLLFLSTFCYLKMFQLTWLRDNSATIRGSKCWRVCIWECVRDSRAVIWIHVSWGSDCHHRSLQLNADLSGKQQVNVVTDFHSDFPAFNAITHFLIYMCACVCIRCSCCFCLKILIFHYCSVTIFSVLSIARYLLSFESHLLMRTFISLLLGRSYAMAWPCRGCHRLF